MKTGHLDGQGLAELRNYNIQNLSSAPTTNLYAGRFYFNTTDHTLYVYDGTAWKDALKQGIVYTEGSGIDITGNVISADLSASDIPDLSLSKITDVTTSASEVNVLDGITVTTSDLNSVTSKIGLTNLSIDSGSSNYLGYDNATGKFSAKVATTVTANSSKLITSGAVQTAINNAIANVYKAQGSVAFASLPTLGSSIEGYVYNISDAFTTTSNFVEGSGKAYPAGTNVVCINTSGTTYKWDVLAGSVDTSSFITASSTNTLTNKTIDADDNTISDLTTSNFKSGTITNSIATTGSSSKIPTESAVRTAIDALNQVEENPALTPSGGICEWIITTDINDPIVEIFDASGNKVLFDYRLTNMGGIIIQILSADNIAAKTYFAIIKG